MSKEEKPGNGLTELEALLFEALYDLVIYIDPNGPLKEEVKAAYEAISAAKAKS